MLALPKALTFRVNVGNDGIEKGLVAARLVDFGLPQGRLFVSRGLHREPLLLGPLSFICKRIVHRLTIG